MFRAAIFDMDGTLIDSGRHWASAEREVFGTVGLEITDEMAAYTAPLTPREVTEYWYRTKPWPSPSLEHMEAAVIRRVGELIRAAPVALPGVREVLEVCRALRWRVGLASNSPDVLCRLVLEQLGLAPEFDAIVSSDCVARGKPDPSIYLEAARRLEVAPRECVAFEDSPVGVRAARAAGMCVVAVTSGQPDFQPDAHPPHLTLPSLAAFAREHAQQLWERAAQ